MRIQLWSARGFALAAASATVIAGVVVVAGPATAAATSMTYDQPGSYTWTVPQNVTSLHVDALGGSGASGSSGAGGAAANVVADFPVTPGETLYVHVGGNAFGVNGGANGGGSSSAGSYTGGGGGGASDIREGGDSLTDRVLVAAGGGGGSGWGFSGGGAGQPGTDGCGAAAQPGTSSAGGSGGGGGCVGYGGSAGALGTGGNGGGYTPAASYGGGGGAGYYGGGGGGPYDGGAGGSNLIPTGATNVSTSFGTVGQTPYIQLSYAAADASAHSVNVATADSSLPADGVSTTPVTAVIVDQFGNALSGETVDFSSSDPGTKFGPVTDNGDGSYTAELTTGTTAGTVTITATDTSGQSPVEGQTTLQITPLSQTVAFDTAAPSPVVGQTYSPAAHGGGSGNAASFSIDAASTEICSITDATVSFDHAGSCIIDADQAGNAQYAPAATAQQVVAVAPAETSTALAVGPHAVTATVTPVAPGGGTPTGTVTFAVDGVTLGTAPLSAGVATLDQAVPSDAAHEVSAVYGGSGDYTGSSDSTIRQNPTITAHVSSPRVKNRYGWYRTPVTVSFSCAPSDDGAQLTEPCPAPVTLSRSRAGQALTRTVIAADGGAATAAVSGINIDTIAPHVSIGGVRNGATYRGAAPEAHCLGHDTVSGIASCRLTTRRHGDLVRYTLRGSDRAGNTATTRGHYHVLSAYLQGATRSHGAFVVHAGHTYTLVLTTAGKSAPWYYYAAVSGRRPGPRGPLMHAAGTSHGRHVWTLPVHIDHAMARHTAWVLGMKAGGSLHLIRIQVVH